jgi:hypothetical protein
LIVLEILIWMGCFSLASSRGRADANREKNKYFINPHHDEREDFPLGGID